MLQSELNEQIKRIKEIRKARRCQHEWLRIEKKPLEVCLICRRFRFRTKLVDSEIKDESTKNNI